jgi:predicted DNA-binding transcriptional regulator YafY
MTEAVEVLRQFKGLSYFADMRNIVSRLEDHVTSAKQKTIPVIDFEKNDNLKGLEHLDKIYHAIVNKQTLSLQYRSFKAHSASAIIFYPYLLKEFRNRWFVFGVTKRDKSLLNLALDRILRLEIAKKESFLENTFFDSATFFDDLVGVTKGLNSKTEKVKFQAGRMDAPYIETKPVHKSQQLIKRLQDGRAIFEIEVVINQELQRELLGFSDGIQVLEPKHLADFMKIKLKNAWDRYEKIHIK